MSIEGGIKGDQKRIVCEKCGKVFFAWRPETAPGVKVKCYFCKHEQEDEASRRAKVESPESKVESGQNPADATSAPS